MEINILINAYLNIKAYGFPFTGGWAEQPYWVIELVKILDPEYKALQSKGKNEPTERKRIGA